MGVSLLAKAKGQAMKILNVPTPSRASHAPTVIGGLPKGCERHVTCGSELARESGGSVDEDIEGADAFAGKPRSHSNRGGAKGL
ncbi:hypothetical protein DBR18_16875 [Pseudomonas sp. HMWF021]|nr:hypothetical protein DBR18_16875 [Pseudomonas sp. HMWF021]